MPIMLDTAQAACDHDLGVALLGALNGQQMGEDGRPRLLTPQEMRDLSDATAHRAYRIAADHAERHGPLTADDLDAVCRTARRVYAPMLTCFLQGSGWLDAGAVSAGVPAAWSDCEYPEFASSVSRRRWLDLFAAAGFTVDGEPAQRPAGIVTLYRGAVHTRRRGMSWTADLAVAEEFAARSAALRGRQPGHVYRLDAPWSAVLAVINGRQECEHVVDTRTLKIAAAGGAA